MVDARRRLTAILSADVASYSRLMGADERATVDTLNDYRLIFKDSIAAHDGRVVDTAGDSVLAVFDSVVEAVECAIEVQRDIGDRNQELAHERRMHFRIGVNLGDVIEQRDGSVYGDGVNIAARLEGLAEPGGITVSGAVYDFVDGKVKATVTFAGEHEVKNIVRPVRVYRVEAASGAATSAIPAAAEVRTLPDRPSIAVLPFVNISEDERDDYFADGISEDITTELSRFQELVVTARNSVFTYKGKAVNIPEVARELNVRYMLEGSVRKGGDRVRVSAQLIDAVGGHHLWAERYDRKVEDVFAVQDELTRKIVATLVGQLVDSERRRSRSDERTANLRAYDLVLRGRELWFRFTREDNCTARELYEQAIELDAEYARAYASLAWTHMMAYEEYWTDDPQDALDKALAIAQQGVQVNRASHSNWLALGQVYYFRKDLKRAIEAHEKAIELNPNDPDGHIFLAISLSVHGEACRAIELLDQAVAMNPNLNRFCHYVYIVAYFNARRYAEAAAIMETLDTTFASHFRWMGATYAHLGHDDAARSMATRYLERYPDFDLVDHLSRVPFTRDEDREHYAEGLRRAGFGEILTNGGSIGSMGINGGSMGSASIDPDVKGAKKGSIEADPIDPLLIPPRND